MGCGLVARVLWHVLLVVGRLLGEAEAPVPELTERSVLFIKRHNVMIGDGCPGQDAGMLDDAGMDADALGDAPPDAPADAMTDAGVSDAGAGDAGVGDAGAGSCTIGDAVTMIVQPEVVQMVPNARFAVLYVTPARPVVTLVEPVFGMLASITAPLVEIEEVEVEDPALGTECAAGCGQSSHSEPQGCGGGGGYTPWAPPGLDDGGFSDDDLSVDLVGPYEVVRAQPTTTAQLAAWLDQLGYEYTQQDLNAVAPYIALGHTVVAVRLAIDAQTQAKLRPLSLTWPGTEIRVPAALARTAQTTKTALTVYIAAEGRYELDNATIDFAQRTSYGGMGFLTRNDITLDQSLPASADPVATHRGSSEYRAVTVERHEIRVPKTVNCEDDNYGCCNDCNTRQQRTRIDLGLIIVAIGVALRRRRRAR